MMKAQYSIDRDTRTLILKYIRKYEEYKCWYHAERDQIVNPSPFKPDGQPRGTNVSDPTLAAAERLEKLENKHRVTVIRAIDQARNCIAVDIRSDAERERLARAIWLSCINGREYNFAAFEGGVACERRQFYYYKNEFLNSIKNILGL